ncbi:MAG: SCP2 sterol-binding domain-containing protein [Candidatus Hodarchaeales archaeon]
MGSNDHKFKYLSEEWLEEVVKQVKEQLSSEDMKNTTSSMMNVYNNCPDGKVHYFYVQFENGLIKEALVGSEDEPVATRKAEFTIIGDYEIFAKISKAELGARSALMRNKIKLKGNMIKALRLASVVDRFNKVISTIPTEF